jgi:hypothetical protein
MRSGRFFWGAFLVSMGTIMLLERFSVPMPDWQALWRFWPLVLVFWGASVLARGSSFAPAAAALAGLMLAVICIGLVGWGFDLGRYASDGPVQTQEFLQPFDQEIHRATFHFSSGAGSFSAEGTTDQLFGATVRSDLGRYVMRGDRIEQSEDVSLRLEGRVRTWSFSRSANRVSLRFNPAVPWDMQFAVGASRVDLDLSGLLVDRLNLEAGASQLRIRLGDRSEETRLSIKSGVSSVRILVPRTSACEIDAQSPLSRKSFKDFNRTGGGSYRTENFGSAEKKVYISLQSGVSDLTVLRY